MKNLAVIIPYRNRENNKKIFIPYINEYLTSKNFSFDIFLIEQKDTKAFNRAKLLNVGYSISSQKDQYESIVMHDIDMLPVNVDYSASQIPTHLASKVEQFNWEIPYEFYFGGITLFPEKIFRQINGYSNNYWGWGAEDDDIFYRIQYSGIPWTRRENGLVRSLSHHRESNSINQNDEILRKAWSEEINYKKEGLNTLEYEILSWESKEDHEFISVKI